MKIKRDIAGNQHLLINKIGNIEAVHVWLVSNNWNWKPSLAFWGIWYHEMAIEGFSLATASGGIDLALRLWWKWPSAAGLYFFDPDSHGKGEGKWQGWQIHCACIRLSDTIMSIYIDDIFWHGIFCWDHVASLNLLQGLSIITGDRFEMVYQSILTQHGSTNSHSRGPLTKMMPVWAWLRNFGAFLGPPHGGAISPYLADLVLGGPRLLSHVVFSPFFFQSQVVHVGHFVDLKIWHHCVTLHFNESCRKTSNQHPKTDLPNSRKNHNGRTFRELLRTPKGHILRHQNSINFQLGGFGGFFLNQIWIPTIESDT